MRPSRRLLDRPEVRNTLLFALLALIQMSACERPTREAESFTSAGVTHLQMGEYDRAIRDFDRALSLHPGLVVAWRHRAIAHREKGDYERAIADYEHALVFAPNDARLLTDRGVAYALLNDPARAIQDFDRAIASRPDYLPALEHRGRAHFILGNFAQAAADLQRGLNDAAPDAGAALWLHFARQRLGQNDAEDLAAHAALADSTRWPAPVLRHLAARLPADSLRTVAASTDSTGARRGCVEFYLGERALIAGDVKEAGTLFERTRSSCPKDRPEHRAAVAELKRAIPNPAR